MLDLLGASTESSARVLECFFFGLSLGAAVASYLLPRIERPWRLVGRIELGVAFLSVPALLLPQWTGVIWSSLGPERLVSWEGWTLKTVCSMLIILPPAFLMGMSFPVLVSIGVGARPDASRRGILLYAGNTIGGMLGLGLLVLVTLQLLGAAGSMLLMMGVNLAVALWCFQRDRQHGAQGASSKSTSLQASRAFSLSQIGILPLGIAFVSGAGVLAVEVLALALANLCAPLSIYPQSSILGCVILLLAVAAWVVAKIGEHQRLPLPILSVSMGLACVGTALAPVIFLSLPGVRDGLFGYGHSFGEFLMTLAGGIFASLSPAMLFAGMVFPLVILWSRGEGSLPGRQMGLLLAVNGIGGIAGTEIAYRVLLPRFGVHVSMGIVGVCYGLVSLVLVILAKERHVGRFLWSLAAAMIACYVTSAILVRLPLYFRS
ncbi:MAG TPA: hypothetical protein VD994_00320, partial [Prosthecobacter sp.]|nr:hypothetical protein [Prosthecobacter sp.]